MAIEIQAKHFDPFQIMDSGQCFRMVALDPHTVETVALGRRLVITIKEPGRFVFDCDTETYESVWKPYFTLDTDYAAILAAAPAGDAYLSRALAEGEGLRILRQDPWETLCCFILSQRKNLPAIRGCVEALCDAYGEPIAGSARKAFPTAERLAGLHPDALRLCALGYRAPYLADAAQKVASGQMNLTALYGLPDYEIFMKLTGIHGVGVKVADCVMLFAYGRTARAPVDVWIRRVIDEVYGGHSPFEAYGQYAGIYQQYLFVLSRNEGKTTLSKPTKTCECGLKTAKARKPARKPTRG